MSEDQKPLVDTADVAGAVDLKDMGHEEHQVVECPLIGTVNVFIQGTRSASEVVIMTVNDLGCDHTMYNDFIYHRRMQGIRDRTVWVQVEVPGQEQGAPDLAADYVFPTMQQIGEDLVHVLDALHIKEVVCFGEGAGANILARFAAAHQDRILGVVLIHCTGTTAGFMESIKDKFINWKLDHIGMNPSAEAYLILHRFGSFAQVQNTEDLKDAIENYQQVLRTKTNPKNLRKFVESFLKRTSISEQMKKLRCPVLFVTGSNSVFRNTTITLHQQHMKAAKDSHKGIIELIQVDGVANVLEERPEKLTESFQYFLQGLGLVSSIPMRHLRRERMRMRSLSMEEYDIPKLSRNRSTSMSGGEGDGHRGYYSSSPPAYSPISEK